METDLHHLAALAEMLALELNGRTIASEDADRPSVVSLAELLARELGRLRDASEVAAVSTGSRQKLTSQDAPGPLRLRT